MFFSVTRSLLLDSDVVVYWHRYDHLDERPLSLAVLRPIVGVSINRITAPSAITIAAINITWASATVAITPITAAARPSSPYYV